MKQLYYKKMLNAKKRLKRFSIGQVSEDKDCKTEIRKNFLYFVTDANIDQGRQPRTPEIIVKKKFNSKKRTEEFTFRVRGQFFVKHKRQQLNVEFRHSLHIKMTWKTKIFSPDKSEILT